MEEPDDVEKAEGASERDLEEPLEHEADIKPESEPDLGEPLFEAKKFTTFWRYYKSTFDPLFFLVILVSTGFFLVPFFISMSLVTLVTYLDSYPFILWIFFLWLSIPRLMNNPTFHNLLNSYVIGSNGITIVHSITRSGLLWGPNSYFEMRNAEKEGGRVSIKREFIPYEDIEYISLFYDIPDRTITLRNLFKVRTLKMQKGALYLSIRPEGVKKHPWMANQETENEHPKGLLVRRPLIPGTEAVIEALKDALQDGWDELFCRDCAIQYYPQVVRKSSETKELRDAFIDIMGDRIVKIAKKVPHAKGIHRFLPWRKGVERADIAYILLLLDYERRTGEKVWPDEVEIDPGFRELLESGVVEFEHI